MIRSSVSGRERRGQDDEVRLAEQLGERLGPADPIEQHLAERAVLLGHGGPGLRAGLRPSTDGHDPAPEGRRKRPDRPADGAQAHDADGHVAQLGALQRLPRALALELEELGQPAADRQDHHQHVFRDGPAEDATRVGHDEAALEGGRGERPLDAGGRGMDPLEARRADQQAIERLGAQPAPEHDLDIVDGAIRKALDRDHDEARIRRGGADPLEVARAVARRQDRAQGDGRRGTLRPAPGPRGRAGRGRAHGIAGGMAAGASRTRRIQRVGSGISSSRGSVSGPSQSRVSAAGPSGIGDGADERLALLVLLHLEVHPRQPEHRALEGRPVGPPLVEALADPLDVGDQVATDLVHDVVAEPLEQAHDRLRLAEQAALLLAHQCLEPVHAA